MEELWTPWRMPYIVSDKEAGGCIFCRLPKETDHHHLILHRGPRTFVIMNLYPYSEGHLMVIPYQHADRLSALSGEERTEMQGRLRQIEGILRRVLGAERFHTGINLGHAAGAGVRNHLHTHLVPRARSTKDRVSSPGGMTATEVEKTYQRLLPHFALER